MTVQTPSARAHRSASSSTTRSAKLELKRRGPSGPPQRRGELEVLLEAMRALERGDFTARLPADGASTSAIAATFNEVASMFERTSMELVRVSKVVGRDGEMMERARLPGARGGWSTQVESFNALIDDLVRPSTEVARVIIAVAAGDLSQKMALEMDGKPVRGEFLRISTSANTMVDQLRSFASDVTRVAREVGTEGKLGGQAEVKMSGTWKDLTESVNHLAGNLTAQVRNIALVTTAVANGDLSQKITVDARGELLELKSTVNTMVDQLGALAFEVMRVAKEVGTEGKLGGKAQIRMSGTWKDLTDGVNVLADNLTSQVRNIALVTTAVANGDLSQKIGVDARGELLALKTTVNKMVDQLGSFASEVTRVAREVGVEGKLGGQASVPGAAGTWRSLTDNVNQLANNLSAQVRAINEVSIAVTQGDLTRSISVEARGEVLALRGNLNQMIANLRDTTQRNEEQDWLKTNLAKFGAMMQGQKTLDAVSRLIMSELTPLVSAHHGAFFVMSGENGAQDLRLAASYAYQERKNLSSHFKLGEGLVGQCALERKLIFLTNVPGDYVQINSGLGQATPLNLLVVPILFEDEVSAVLELASFQPFSEIHRRFLDQLSKNIGVVLNMIGANTRTVDALKKSQSLAEELQNQSKALQQQQYELRKSNQELGAQAQSLKTSEEQLKFQREELQQVNEQLSEKATLLAGQKRAVEDKNLEVERSREALEEKAAQLVLSSKYKSEFLANMSHELRTPLNSLLILAQLLADNTDGHLAPKEVDFATTIHAAGSDLLTLINDILDLSKIESGNMTVDVEPLEFSSLREFAERNFGQLAQHKGLTLGVELASDLPASISTDPRRVQQVLKNLLANAFKFTEKGGVTLSVERVDGGWSTDHPTLGAASAVFALSVADTGIGIAPDKQSVIFQAFQQADGTTSRKYGGTGLGLSICREVTRLLGGEVIVASTPAEGSTFRLFLPASYVAAADVSAPPGNGSEAPDRRDGRADRRGEPVDRPLALAVDSTAFTDDRATIAPGDRVLLAIEDDPTFARVLYDVVTSLGFKCVVALTGEAGLALVRQVPPDAITLDLGLPGADGWMVLDRLKHTAATRHIPVFVISADDASRRRSLQIGALDFLSKPVTRDAIARAVGDVKSRCEPRISRLLIVEDDDLERGALVDLLGSGGVETTAVASAEEALTALGGNDFDCIVLDLGLPRMSGFELMDRMHADELVGTPPVIVYTGRDLTPDENAALAQRVARVVVKTVRSREHLVDQTALFLHRKEASLSPTKQGMLKKVRDSEPGFAGKTVLVVDDDFRNIFAVTSLLERHQMKVLYAENGRRGLEVLEANPAVQLVLMDVMMPEMDGYEASRAIRQMSRYATLPIVAITANAMKGDRDKCIAAGASDYLAKPLDTEQLLSLLRVWLF